MDAKRREHLRSKWKRFQARRELSELQAAYESIQASRTELFGLLAREGVAVVMLHPTGSTDVFLPTKYEDWLEDRFTFGPDGSIDWSNSRDHEQQASEALRNYDGCSTALRQVVGRDRLGDPFVIIVGAAAGSPIIRLRLSEAIRHAAEIFALDGWNTWIYNPTADWCIEYHHDGVVSYGCCPKEA
mgnify:CR=1 FL=1